MKKGFTLIELTIVLLIIGLAAGIVAVRMGGPLSRAKLDDVTEVLKTFDGNTRSYAWNHGKNLHVKVDLAGNVISRFDEEENEIGMEMVLPSDFTIEGFYVANPNDEDDQSSNEKVLKYSNRGLSCSYAVKLADQQRSRWVVFAGMTGEAFEIEDDEQVQEIMEMLSRPDAG